MEINDEFQKNLLCIVTGLSIAWDLWFQRQDRIPIFPADEHLMEIEYTPGYQSGVYQRNQFAQLQLYFAVKKERNKSMACQTEKMRK